MDIQLKKNINLFNNFKKDIRDYLLDLSQKVMNISKLMESYLNFLDRKQKLFSTHKSYHSSKYLGRKRLRYIGDNYRNMSLSSNELNNDRNNSNNLLIKEPKITSKVFPVNCVKDNAIITGYRLLMKYNQLKFYIGPYDRKEILIIISKVIKKEIVTIQCTKNNYYEVIGDCVKCIKTELSQHFTLSTLSKSGKLKNMKNKPMMTEKKHKSNDENNLDNNNIGEEALKEKKYENKHHKANNNISNDYKEVEEMVAEDDDKDNENQADNLNK